jgi:hypothetical protein
MSPEEVEAESARRSLLAKRLWQDPDYVAVTLPAMQEAGIKRRGTPRRSRAATSADDDPDGDGSSTSSSSRQSSGSRAKRSTSSRRTAAGEGSSSDGSDLEPQTAAQKTWQPSQKVGMLGLVHTCCVRSCTNRCVSQHHPGRHFALEPGPAAGEVCHNVCAGAARCEGL